jgi:predicted metal-dependent HD superfamily phosphohydrolase
MTSQLEQSARLADEWNRLMDSLNVPRENGRLRCFEELRAAYSESHRYWHNLDHIDSLLAEIGLPSHRLKGALATLELAVWYHDVVYDTHRVDNEARSAEVARNALVELDIDRNLIERVCDLILMTRDHQAPVDDTEAQLFLDADMSILGTNSVLYQEYAADIRKEYAWIPDHVFYPGRRTVLGGFLSRPTIFRTEWFKQWESAARMNIAAEIAQIDETLRTLAP